MFKTVRGMRDLLPEEAEMMRYVEQVSREISRLYCYDEIITPILESYELLAAKTSQEIRERMYTFKDLGDRKVAMRPEFTASIARLVVAKLRNAPKPLRLFSVGSLYRYDEPQYGRFREFWQSNFELLGSSRPEADAEILILTNNLLKQLRLEKHRFKIGHSGILNGVLTQEGLNEPNQNKVRQLLDKKLWPEALIIARKAGVTRKCLKVLENLFKTKGKGPFQVLSQIKDNITEYEASITAADNLTKILQLVKDSGEQLDVIVEAGLARGLKYYTGMIFESFIPEMDVALGGGGRYDKLIKLFGGEAIPAVGVAQGIDRIVLALNKQKLSFKPAQEKTVVTISIEEECMGKALELSAMLRNNGLPVEVAVMGRSVSRALTDANRRGITHAVIIGPKELEEKKVVLKEMKKNQQRTVGIHNLTEEILSSSP